MSRPVNSLATRPLSEWRLARVVAAALLVVVLTACGGDSGGGNLDGEDAQMADTETAVLDLGAGEPTEREVTGRDSTEEREISAPGGAVAFETPADGHRLYRRNCAVCHGNDGDGNIGPALAGNRNLASSSYTVARIQLGGGGMPPFARLLSSEEIAAVASFVRSDLGNGLSPVTGEQVELQWNGYERGMRYGVYNLRGGDR